MGAQDGPIRRRRVAKKIFCTVCILSILCFIKIKLSIRSVLNMFFRTVTFLATKGKFVEGFEDRDSRQSNLES